MRTARASLEYLLHASDAGLESMQLNRLGRSADLRKELGQVVTEMVDSEVEAGLARWLLSRRRGQGVETGADEIQARELIGCSSAAHLFDLPRAAAASAGLVREDFGDRQARLWTERSENSPASAEQNLMLPDPLLVSGPREPNRFLAMQLEFFGAHEPAATDNSIEPLAAGLSEAATLAFPELTFTVAHDLAMETFPAESSPAPLRCAASPSGALQQEMPRRFSSLLMRLFRLSRHSLAKSTPLVPTARNVRLVSISSCRSWRRISRFAAASRARGVSVVASSGRAAAHSGWRRMGAAAKRPQSALIVCHFARRPQYFAAGRSIG